MSDRFGWARDEAIHYAVEHSNKIEREPVSGPSFDNHLRAALLARTAANAGQLLHPRVLHQLLMEGLPSRQMMALTPGEYRDVEVSVGGHQCPLSRKVPSLMVGWLNTLDKAQDDGRPDLNQDLVRWWFHAWFESIHPFQDGNGRVGRLLWWNMEMLVGKSITVIAYEERFAYYDRLDAWRADHGNKRGMNPFR